MTFNVLGIFIVLCVGANEVLKGRLSVGVLFSMTIYVQRLYGPIVTLGTEYINIKNTKPMIDIRCKKILENRDSILGGVIDWSDVKGKINFVNVYFKYKDKWILHNFTMEVSENTITGIIGENGSGKSTLIKLLSKLCAPQSGAIYLDGIPIEKITYESLKKYIAVIPQDNFLPYGSLKNIMGISSGGKGRRDV